MPEARTPPVEAALRKVIADLEGENARLKGEMCQLRRQVAELERLVKTERGHVKGVLEALRSGVTETLAKCEAAAIKPRVDKDADPLEHEEDHFAGLDDDHPEATWIEYPESPLSHTYVPWWKVPFRRRAQTFCTLMFTWTTPLLASTLFLVYVLWSRNLYLVMAVLMYVGWMFLLDDEAPRTGRPWWFISRIRGGYMTPIWRLCAEYYPLKLVRSAELPPDRNYMFCLHPHGVFSLTHAINFATNGTGFFDLFPGVRCLLVTLRQQFKIPFHREYLLSLGTIEVSRDALLGTLSKGPGWSIAIVPGGAQEASDAYNGTMRLTILKRKGFVRIALRTGASLVPVIAFGENDLYVASKGSKRMFVMRLWTRYLKRFYGLASPVAMGRGVFNRSCPDPFMLPFRKPTTTVVGPPLTLPRIPDPLPSDVDYWHGKYIEALKELWEHAAPKYGPGIQLELV